MAPLPENNTPRMFVEYTVGGQEHVSVIRLANGSTSVDAISAYATLAPAMAELLHTSDSVTGARFSAQGSNLSFPINVAAEPGTTTSTPDVDRKPCFFSVTGRSSDGRDVRVTMFSQYADVDADGYRMSTPTGDVATWYNAVTGASVDARTISGLTPTWNSYVNIGVNAYYQRKARRSG